MTKNSKKIIKLSKIGILGALAGVVMTLEFPLLFMAPGFYQLDLSEIIVMLGGFSLGPAAVFPIELIKILIKIFIKGSYSMYVGELSNLVLGLSLTLPAAIIYKKIKTKKGALLGMTAGTLCLSVISPFINGLVMIPFYVSVMGLPFDEIISQGNAVYSFVDNIYTFLIFIVVPFNLLKGIISSVAAGLLYKPLSPVLKWEGRGK